MYNFADLFWTSSNSKSQLVNFPSRVRKNLHFYFYLIDSLRRKLNYLHLTITIIRECRTVVHLLRYSYITEVQVNRIENVLRSTFKLICKAIAINVHLNLNLINWRINMVTILIIGWIFISLLSFITFSEFTKLRKTNKNVWWNLLPKWKSL